MTISLVKLKRESKMMMEKMGDLQRRVWGMIWVGAAVTVLFFIFEACWTDSRNARGGPLSVLVREFFFFHIILHLCF